MRKWENRRQSDDDMVFALHTDSCMHTEGGKASVKAADNQTRPIKSE